MNLKIPFFILLLIILILSGCSSGKSNPVVPAEKTIEFNLPSVQIDPKTTNRKLLGIWEIAFDSQSLKSSIFPNRVLEAHYNVTQLIPQPTIILNSYNPQTKIVNIDMTITNPYSVDVYDVRLIIYTDNLGHKLTNGDDWTSMYDIPGGLPINPFKAYAKDKPNRIFAGQSQQKENFKIYLPGGNWHFTIAIDASYPTNCEEPYELTNFTQGIILDQLGSSTELEVTAHSWSNEVNSVKLYCPAITGTALVSFNPIDSEKWGYTLTNNTGAASGNYFGYLIATTSKSGSLALYDEVTIKITPLNSGWARTWGGVGDDGCNDVAVDMNGNIYVTGYFASTVDFNPDSILEDIHTASGKGDAFIAKYDKYGNFQWARTWGGEYTGAQDRGEGLDIDSMGNVLIAGAFYLIADFGTGGTPDIRTSKGDSDIFLTKYDSNGNYLWTKTCGGGGTDSPDRIIVGRSDDIAISGYFEGTADFNPDPAQADNHSSNGGYDAFLIKLSSSGTYQWGRTWGGSRSYGDFGRGVTMDSNGNVYCSGKFDGICDFDPGSGTDIHTPVQNLWWDAFLSSFDSNGDFRWAHTWGSGYQDEARECAVDEYDDVYVTGSFFYTVDFNPDPLETEERTAVWENDVFVSKFAPDGDFKWVLTWGGPSLDFGRLISSDHNGHFWVAGYAYNCDFDPGAGTDFKEGGYFLSKFEITGDYIWSQLWSFDVPLIGFDVDWDGSSFFCGWYSENDTDFDPGPRTWTSQNYSNGFDCFIVKVLSSGFWD